MTLPKILEILKENHEPIIAEVSERLVPRKIANKEEWIWIYRIKLHDGFLTSSGYDEITGESLDEIFAKWNNFQYQRLR